MEFYSIFMFRRDEKKIEVFKLGISLNTICVTGFCIQYAISNLKKVFVVFSKSVSRLNWQNICFIQKMHISEFCLLESRDRMHSENV